MLSWVSVLTFDLESHHHLHMTLAIALPVDPLFWWKRIALFLLLIRDIKIVIRYALKREVFTFYCVWKLTFSICKKKNDIPPLTLALRHKTLLEHAARANFICKTFCSNSTVFHKFVVLRIYKMVKYCRKVHYSSILFNMKMLRF